MTRPHMVILHRWQDRYALYEDYVDHRRHAVTYVTTEVGRAGVPAAAADVVVVPATDDLAAARSAVAALSARHGAPRTVVALKEDDLPIAARLRRQWRCPGMTPEQVVLFTDKLAMSRAVSRAGVPAPAFAAADDAAAVRAFAAEHGFPLVVKPRVGSASDGVRIVRTAADIDRIRFDGGRPLLVQRFQPGDIYHVDGVFDGTAPVVWRASRYLNTCLDFRHGSALGSVEEDDPGRLAAIGAFTERALAALTGDPLVFHLEIFLAEPVPGAVSCTFLEVGARVGGAEIAFLWREVHGYDLMGAAFAIAAGAPPPEPDPRRPTAIGGWLLVPAPADRPCRITESTSMLGRPDGPYAEVVLAPGQVLPAADAYYEHVGGRFRFRAGDSATVQRSIMRTAADFRVRGAPLDAGVPAPARV
jgi:biotin carboxylase